MLNQLRKIISYDNPIRRGWHFLKGFLAAVIYGFPGKKMVVIGITGTNGKTTTTHMVEHLLHAGGKKVGMMSTVDFAIHGKHWENETKKTTLSPFKTQKFLKKCVKEGVEYLVVESSSHALHQFRLWGVNFSIAAITNLTHEHLDYHGTMKKYAEAKKILFKMAAKNAQKKESATLAKIPHQKASILNVSDQFYKDFEQVKIPFQISYGLGRGDLRATEIEYSKGGSTFTVQVPSNLPPASEGGGSHQNQEDSQLKVKLGMMGSFNVENALAATGVALACRLNLKEIGKGLESFQGVAGRMERIKSPKGFEVIVDFALTPDALERLYSTLRESAEGRIIGLIGSCGDRDQEKRPDMGRIVAKYCDLTIVTDEEPYSEDPMQIMEAVLEGAKEVKTFGEDLLLIEDRKEAMAYAIKRAQKNDIIVVTGMGSFKTRTMNDGLMDWDEREVARELIEKYS